MKRVYSHPDLTIVQLVKHQLDNHGIEAVIRGEYAAAVAGGGAGLEAWNELWIVDDSRDGEAAEVIQRMFEEPAVQEGEPWTCPGCGEEVEATFELCWNCQAVRPETAA